MRVKLKPNLKPLAIRNVRPAVEAKIPEWEKKCESYGENITRNWDHKPQFKTTSRVTTGNIVVWSRPVGPNLKYWNWVSRGTRPHTIRAAPGKVLAFKTDYKPKTTPVGFFGGPGTATGQTVFTKVVHHPGTKPRNFERMWDKWLRTWFPKEVQETVRKALRS